MKAEFKRFGLETFALLIVASQFFGAVGLFVGLWFNSMLVLSSFGLAFLMLLGVFVRVYMKDSIWISLPALFYMALNTYIFVVSIN